MTRRAVLTLAGFALVSEAAYLIAALRLPWWRYGGSLQSWRRILNGTQAGAAPAAELTALGVCLFAVALLVAVHIGSRRLAANERAARRIVWAGAIVFGGTLMGLLPITSDLFSYLGQAHQVTDLGVNPLLTAMRDAPSDPLVQAYPTVYGETPSSYGPAWLLIASLGTLGRRDEILGVLYLKALSFAAYLAATWLLSRILDRVRPESKVKGMVLFSWNPLVLLMAVGDGHNDMVMMSLVLLATWFLLRRRWALAMGTLVLSIWVKYVSLIFLPLFLLYALRAEPVVVAGRIQVAQFRSDSDRGVPSWSLVRRGSFAAVAVSAVVLIPFGGLGWLPQTVSRLLHPVNGCGPLVELSGPVLMVGIGLFVVAYGLVAWRFVRGRNELGRLADACFVVALLAFLLGAARSQPWHLVWAAALAPLSGARWAPYVITGLSALMLVGQVWIEWGAPGLGLAS